MYSKKKLGDCSFDGESIDNSKRIGFDEINMIIEAKYVLMDLCHCTDDKRYTPGFVKLSEEGGLEAEVPA
jgi:hypothetical protein